MHGLIRIRQFTLSEGHLMCTPEQLEDEFKGCLELANYMLKTLGLYEDATYRFSQWDENNREKYLKISIQDADKSISIAGGQYLRRAEPDFRPVFQKRL